uniref:Uncharacterized protein n=1 Tax=Panagrolaimus superbus TaxID=310955 RepID=A0A914YHC5_9BILA
MVFVKKYLYFGTIIFLSFCKTCYGSPFDKVIDAGCRTNPTWTICQTFSTKTKLKDDVFPRSTDNPTSSIPTSMEFNDNINDTIINELIISLNETTTPTSIDVESEEPKNLSPETSSKDMVFQAASFLKNESFLDNASETSESAKTSSESGTELETLKEHYCQTYIKNFTNYCHGKERFQLPEVLRSRLTAFCDSFKATCYPMHSTPCTPDCDQRFHAHCTVACKCNYMYPFVIKFCSPVTIHSLENVCRSWFIKCAKIHSIDD